MSSQRWIFKKANKYYRYGAILLSFLVTIIIYFVFKNIFFGTFFLFLFSYFLGAFKGRRRIEVIQNESVESAITELCKLFESSVGNIYILTRSLNPRIYNQVDVIQSLERAKNRSISIKIICQWELVQKAHSEIIEAEKLTGILKLVEDRRIELFSIDKDLSLVNHFAVVDNVSFRLEQKHGEEEDRKAIIVYRSRKAKIFQSTFEELLKKPFCQRIVSTNIRMKPASFNSGEKK